MYRAIPIKWKVSGLNASKSEIVVKTITLRHTIQGYFINTAFYSKHIKLLRLSQAGAVQFINLKSYDEDCLLRQCFTISTTTNKTVTQTQVKSFCLSKVDSFLSFMILTVFPHGYRKWFPCRLSPPYSLWL